MSDPLTMFVGETKVFTWDLSGESEASTLTISSVDAPVMSPATGLTPGTPTPTGLEVSVKFTAVTAQVYSIYLPVNWSGGNGIKTLEPCQIRVLAL